MPPPLPCVKQKLESSPTNDFSFVRDRHLACQKQSVTRAVLSEVAENAKSEIIVLATHYALREVRAERLEYRFHRKPSEAVL
jgi:hypothetical protein